VPVDLVMALRLLLAAALGAAIGYQRERANKPAGLRTHVLIAAGAALFTIASTYAFGVGADPSRVAAGVVAGIGLAAGAGLYIVSVVTTAVVIIVLLLPHPIR
jgi:putative Mg2+ transporter-C (MgtC) family protein